MPQQQSCHVMCNFYNYLWYSLDESKIKFSLYSNYDANIFSEVTFWLKSSETVECGSVSPIDKHLQNTVSFQN